MRTGPTVTCIRCQQPLDAASGEHLRLVETGDGAMDLHARRRVCSSCVDAADAAAIGAAEAWVRPARADVRLGDQHVGTVLVTDSDFPWLAGWWQEGPAWGRVQQRLHRLAELHDRGDHRAASLADGLAEAGLTVAFADGLRGDVLVVVRPDGTAEIDTSHRRPIPGGLTADDLTAAV